MCICSATCAQFLVTGCGRPCTAIGQLFKDNGWRVTAHLFVINNVMLLLRAVTRPILQSLEASLLLSQADYDNVTPAGIPSYLAQWLQAVKNAAAVLPYLSS